MRMCKFYRFMYFILPFKTIRSFLIKRHLGVCRDCRKTIQLDTPLPEVKWIKAWAQKEQSLWPEVVSGIKSLEQAKAAPKKTSTFYPLRMWRWATAFVVLTFLVIVTLVIHRGGERKASSRDVPGVQSPSKVIVKRAELKGKNARPIIFQTPTVSIIFLMEDKKNGG